jgi:hypothetical protein
VQQLTRIHAPRRRGRVGTALAGLALTAACLGAVTAGPAAAVRSVPPATCPSATGNAAFVRYIYMTILNRCPDAGAAPWVTALDHGLARATFTDQVDMSRENLSENNVKPLYESVLGRAPTATELTAGERLIQRTRGDANLVATLASSAEFYATVPGADAAAKDAIAVSNILDRTPADSGPTTYWGMKLGVPSTTASRFRVAMGLEHSNENAESWVGGIYFVALQRNPRPDRFAFWVAYLQGPGQWRTFRLFTRFLATPEAYNLAQTNPPFMSFGPQKLAHARLARW